MVLSIQRWDYFILFPPKLATVIPFPLTVLQPRLVSRQSAVKTIAKTTVSLFNRKDHIFLVPS